MQLCYFDAEYYVEVRHDLVTSAGTEICIECKQLIHAGTEHYIVDEWTYDRELDGDDTITLGLHTCCEQCGDLALSWMALGQGWGYGDLRNDIQDLNDSL